MAEGHSSLYGNARYYDIAFGYRDYPSECSFLGEVSSRFGTGELTGFLELAAGPARHAITLAERCGYGAAIDLAPEMAAYGRALAAEAGVAFDYHVADMVAFRLERSFDLAALLLDSASYLLTNAAFSQHLAAVARCLRSGGIYVLQMQHPAETFRLRSKPPPRWEIEHAGDRVLMEWGHVGDPFDPVSQQAIVSTRLVVVTAAGQRLVVEESAPQRCFSPNELRALVEASPAFDLVHIYGDMSTGAAFAPTARYMVPVLRRR